jgi:Flp pilus assembly protein TadD
MDAEAIFKGLIALDSHVYYGYAGLGAMALAEEKLEEAVEKYQRAAELNPQDPTVHANLGEAFLRMGRFDEAAVEFKKALRLDPQAADPGANRARAFVTGIQFVMAGTQRVAPEA